jgi:hypothetical protein
MGLDEHELAELVGRQAGVVSRQQLLALGWTTSKVAHRIRSGRWQLLHPGVYATFTGSLEFEARVWAGLLHAGAGAIACHATAAALQKLIDTRPAAIDVMVADEHRVVPRPGLRVHRTRHLASRRKEVASIPQTRIEDTVLDLVEASASPDDVVGWLTRGCQRRLTTPGRLSVAARGRPRLRWRRLVAEVVADVESGVASPLERRYHRDVERPHSLPRGVLNAQVFVRGMSRYCDVLYEGFQVRVELEGLAYHPEDQRWRDARRDNLAALSGDVVLRYDWRAVTARPCATAGEVAAVLASRGWSGRPLACGPSCALRRAA